MMMRSTAIGLAALLLLALVSTDALARHGGGGGGGGAHWSGGGAHWSGGGAHWAGAHWSGGGARWAGAHWAGGPRWSNWNGRRVVFFHRRRFFGGPFFVGYASADFGCWRWQPTPWGWQRAWVCGNPYYGYF